MGPYNCRPLDTGCHSEERCDEESACSSVSGPRSSVIQKQILHGVYPELCRRIQDDSPAVVGEMTVVGLLSLYVGERKIMNRFVVRCYLQLRSGGSKKFTSAAMSGMRT